MSCKDQLGNPINTCQQNGSSIPKIIAEIPEDLDGVVQVLSGYPTWSDFQSGFAHALAPAFDAYKEALTAFKKAPDGEGTRTAFEVSRQNYIQAIYRFLGDPDLPHLRKAGKYTRLLWDAIPGEIPDAYDTLNNNRRARPPEAVLGHLDWTLYDLRSHLIDHQGAVRGDLARQLLAARHQEQDSLLARTGGVPIPSSLQPLVKALWQSNNLLEFKRQASLSLVEDVKRYREEISQYRKCPSHRQRERVQGIRNNLINKVRACFGYQEPPESKSPANDLWSNCEWAVTDLTQKQERKYPKPQSAEDIMDEAFSNMPNKIQGMLFSANGDLLPPEIACGNLLEISLKEGVEVPIEIISRYPALLVEYGV